MHQRAKRYHDIPALSNIFYLINPILLVLIDNDISGLQEI
jgi:hypothetical protein